MNANVQFIHSTNLRKGDARALKITDVPGGDAVVFLDAADGVLRVVQDGRETSYAPWPVQQVLNDVLDPHVVLAE